MLMFPTTTMASFFFVSKTCGRVVQNSFQYQISLTTQMAKNCRIVESFLYFRRKKPSIQTEAGCQIAPLLWGNYAKRFNCPSQDRLNSQMICWSQSLLDCRHCYNNSYSRINEKHLKESTFVVLFTIAYLQLFEML